MVHFLQFVHLFCCSSSTKFLKPESGGSILALNYNIFMLPKVQQVRPKGPPFGFFSALCDFFSKIFEYHQRVHCIFLKFSVCKNRLMGLNDLQMLPIVVFGLVRPFRKFFKCLQRVPLHFFLFFQRMDDQKLPNAPFYICRHYATYRGPKKMQKNFNFFLFFPHVGFVEENTWHIEVLLLFLSLRYGSDLGRSRLVFTNSAKTPLYLHPIYALCSIMVAQSGCRSWVWTRAGAWFFLFRSQ